MSELHPPIDEEVAAMRADARAATNQAEVDRLGALARVGALGATEETWLRTQTNVLAPIGVGPDHKPL